MGLHVHSDSAERDAVVVHFELTEHVAAVAEDGWVLDCDLLKQVVEVVDVLVEGDGIVWDDREVVVLWDGGGASEYCPRLVDRLLVILQTELQPVFG